MLEPYKKKLFVRKTGKLYAGALYKELKMGKTGKLYAGALYKELKTV